MENKLSVSSSPHLKTGEITTWVMLDVIIALVPALVMATILFGWRALFITLVSVGACVLFEFLSRLIMKRSNSLGDLSAVVTGILLAFNLPADIPVWEVIIGDFVAIVVVKQLFGGLGKNFVNPAIVGRITLMISFPGDMAKSQWIMPAVSKFVPDGATGATPLAIIKAGGSMELGDLFFGTRPGCLGETCVAALLIGGLYLVMRRVISPLIPLIFMGTTVGITWIFGQDPLYNLMSGGLMLGAIFMATDYTTCPVNIKGKIVFAVGCGIITAVIRLFGNMPEGVSISILLMNILVPHIENLTAPKPFGYVKPPKKGKDSSKGGAA